MIFFFVNVVEDFYVVAFRKFSI